MNKLIRPILRQRLGIPENEPITFEKLDDVLIKMAKEIPFENLSIIENRNTPITMDNLYNKMILRKEGGLCYELNTVLYYFLCENGFHATMIRGITYDHNENQWSASGRTHIINLIEHNGQPYIVDSGFGGNLPLKPVPLNGDVVVSDNGEFRVEKVNNEHGDCLLHMKLKHKHDDWNVGYAFDSTKEIKDLSELDDVQSIITHHPQSRFNKKPLLTKRTDRGTITLTNSSFTQWIDGIEHKQEVNDEMFKELLKTHFDWKF
ncbi:arylamine N-acetyltransferase [Paenibacillus sp. PR3]|uniref:Arylamine N-acetyltransferase n=1 Tax=Paenibacillus terricola TaxID=2763503 RepID=A0ABR8MSV8_9BACL|nr:arylamine N-acetyltransferase [Paenibacillus terricola]MBD3918376.1 arylamine N-acetyltransferase [Paenibacillus terricola]